MKKAYEVKYKDGDKIKTVTAKGYDLIGSLYELCQNRNIYENLISVSEISFERYYILNIAATIANAETWLDCEEECVELCRLADMESEWREAGGDTFESVLNEAAKKLNVDI